MKVKDLIIENDHVQGVHAEDFFTKKTYKFRAKVVLNATGVFADEIRHKEDPKAHHMMVPSQGVHIVLPTSFLSKDTAILIPKTADGRVLFVVPWHNKVLVGTTDTLKNTIELEPHYLEEEIEFLMKESAKYLARGPRREDILSVYSGLRPLIREKNKSTKAISREHMIEVGKHGLVTIVGGKWTTFRKMGEDAIDACRKAIQANWKKSGTEHLKLHGYLADFNPSNPRLQYGSDQDKIDEIIRENPELKEKIHPNLFYIQAEVVFAVRYEMAQKLEDVLARRTRSLFLDSKSALACAPSVAKIMAKELGKGTDWIDHELREFEILAKNYMI